MAAARIERQVALVGQELHSFDDVFSGPVAFDFAHLEPTIDALLAGAPDPASRVYVFGVTEPQQFDVPASGADGAAGTATKVLSIPVMVLACCAVEPPSQLGITSVQSASERIVDMRHLKMGWCP